MCTLQIMGMCQHLLAWERMSSAEQRGRRSSRLVWGPGDGCSGGGNGPTSGASGSKRALPLTRQRGRLTVPGPPRRLTGSAAVVGALLLLPPQVVREGSRPPSPKRWHRDEGGASLTFDTKEARASAAASGLSLSISAILALAKKSKSIVVCSDLIVSAPQWCPCAPRASFVVAAPNPASSLITVRFSS
jgi:hypothetical protein